MPSGTRVAVGAPAGEVVNSGGLVARQVVAAASDRRYLVSRTTNEAGLTGLPTEEERGAVARAKWCGPEIYDVASRLVERCLRHDRSLFSADQAVWTLDLAQALDGRVGIEEKGTFVEKLERQLEGLEADSVQLAAELFYVQLLAESDTSGDTKAKQINRILGLAPGATPMPDELVKALYAGGVAGYGAGKRWRGAYMRFLVRFLIAWKSLDAEEAGRRLTSPWALRDFVNEIRSSTDALQANALLHLIFPDTFEYMLAPSDRQRLTAAFSKAPGVADAGDDEDRKIEAIRKAATEGLGRELELYSEPFHRGWNEDPTPQWSELVSWAKRIFERDDFDRMSATTSSRWLTRSEPLARPWRAKRPIGLSGSAPPSRTARTT
jgi:hypothetical protein